jgi:hypothetical protein
MKWFALTMLLAAPALAYNEAVHALITGRALAQAPGMADELLPPTQADLDAFRALFWKTAAADPRFLARFPSVDAFDAWAFKEFLMLDPAATIHGFDLVPSDARPLRRLQLLQLASRWPDDDERNQHRYLRDPKTHEILLEGGGRAQALAPGQQPIPYDPGTLDLGSLTGPTSQGHAHYGLVTGPLSDDPAVLKSDPRRFAVPPTVHAYGADFAQLYTDLALLAEHSDLPSRQWLAMAFAGSGFHHLEDVSNQIHTVQVGIYEFFQAAFIQSKLQDLKTLGGLFGERRSLRQLGLRLIANHHILSEDLFARRVAQGDAPGVNAAMATLDRDDPIYLAAATSAVASSGGQFGRAIAQTDIDESSLEGAEVYRLAWKLTRPELRDGMGKEFVGGKDDPDLWVEHGPKTDAVLAQFYELESHGLRRAATALRLWERDFRAAPPALISTEIAYLISYHQQAAARRAAYRPAAAERQGIAWGYPIAAAALLLLFALLLRRLAR